MGIASMVIGIISAIICFFPFCNYFTLIPSAIGLMLGIADVAIKSKKKQEGKGQGVAGIVLNIIAIIIIILFTLVTLALGGAASAVESLIESN